MGNDDQINKEITTGSKFLPEEIKDLDSGAEVYSLEDEFARTRENRNYKLPLFVVLFIAFVVGCAYLYTIYLQKSSEANISIDIQDFEDMRLKEVLDSARNRGNNIDVLKINLQVLRVEMLNTILTSRRNISVKELAVIAETLPEAETDNKIQALRKQGVRNIAIIKARYRRRIYLKKAEIAAIENIKRQNEQSLKDKKAAKNVSNEDRLYTLKMKKLKEAQQSGIEVTRKYYNNYAKFIVQRYNPRFRSARIAEILSHPGTLSLSDEGTMQDFDPYISKAGYSSEKFQKLRENISAVTLLVKRLKRVPYHNSVALSLKAVDSITSEIIKYYESLWTSLLKAYKQKDTQVKQYRYSFDYQIDEGDADGFVLDARDKKNIIVYMGKNTQGVKAGDIAEIYKDDSRIGKIQFFRDPDQKLMARVMSTKWRKKAEPLNSIKLQKR